MTNDRFALERSPEQAFAPFDRTPADIAGYDVVDNDPTHGRVLAFRVRYEDAKEIVRALNLANEIAFVSEPDA